MDQPFPHMGDRQDWQLASLLAFEHGLDVSATETATRIEMIGVASTRASHSADCSWTFPMVSHLPA
jgi:hypothetical protein